jgi:hypothetical protein
VPTLPVGKKVRTLTLPPKEKGRKIITIDGGVALTPRRRIAYIAWTILAVIDWCFDPRVVCSRGCRIGCVDHIGWCVVDCKVTW